MHQGFTAGKPKERIIVITIAVFACLLLLGGTAFVAVRFWRSRQGLGPHEAETAEQRRQSVRAAFTGSQSASGPEAQAIGLLMDDVAALFSGQSTKDRATIIDVDAMFEELERLGGLPAMSPGDRQLFKSSWLRGFEQNRGSGNSPLAWTRHEVCSIQMSGNGREAVVYVRAWRRLGVGRFRFWTVKRGRNWRIYDWEDVQGGLRMTSVTSGLIASSGGMGIAPPAWTNGIGQLQSAGGQLAQGDVDGAERTLKGVEGMSFPREFEGVRAVLRARIHLERRQAEEAIKSLDEAEQLLTDSPILLILRARALALLGRYAEAAAQARKYLDLLGDDGDAFFVLGEAEEGLNHADAAAEAYRKALAADPEQVLSVAGLVRTTRGTIDWDALFKNASKPEALLVTAGEPLVERIGWDQRLLAQSRPTTLPATRRPPGFALEQLEAMVASYERLGKGGPSLAYYQAEVKMAHGRFADAARLLEEAMPKLTGQESGEGFEAAYVRAMVEAGNAMEAYRKARVPAQRFPLLANLLLNKSDGFTLQQLILVHRQRDPKDPIGYYYEGTLRSQQRRMAEAAGAFETASTLTGDDQLRRRIIWQWAPAAAAAGTGLESYQRTDLKTPFFTSLAPIYVGEHNLVALDRLVAAHAKAAPDDSQLPRWEVELQFMRGQYEPMVRRIRQIAPKAPKEQAWRLQHLLIRGLVRLKQYDQAMTEAGDNDYQRLFVLASAGRTAEATAALEQLLKSDEYELADLMEDPDLGPLLEGPAYQAIREKHPPSTRSVGPH